MTEEGGDKAAATRPWQVLVPLCDAGNHKAWLRDAARRVTLTAHVQPGCTPCTALQALLASKATRAGGGPDVRLVEVPFASATGVGSSGGGSDAHDAEAPRHHVVTVDVPPLHSALPSRAASALQHADGTVTLAWPTAVRRACADPKPPLLLRHQVELVRDVKARVAAGTPPHTIALHWRMGSCKTQAAVRLLEVLPATPLVLIVCPNTLIEYWATEVRTRCRQRAGTASEIHVVGYTEFHRLAHDDPRVCEGAATIFDEAHNLRNLTAPMREDVAALRRSAHLLLLSGTLLVNDEEDVWGLLPLLGVRDVEDAVDDRASGATLPSPDAVRADLEAATRAGTLALYRYDPREDVRLAHRFPVTTARRIDVVMPWLDVLHYMLHYQKDTTLGHVTVCTSHTNAYKVAARTRCNTDAKMAALVDAVRAYEAAHRLPVMVFSNFLGDGLARVQAALAARAPHLRVALLSGDTPTAERQAMVDAANAGRVDVQLISEAGKEGTNFTGGFHALLKVEPHVNHQSAAQTDNRIVRLDAAPTLVALECAAAAAEGGAGAATAAPSVSSSSSAPSHAVDLVQCVSVFPRVPPTREETRALQQAARAYMGDAVEEVDVAAALQALVAKHGMTADEKLLADNAIKHARIEAYLTVLHACATDCGPPPAAPVASAVPAPHEDAVQAPAKTSRHKPCEVSRRVGVKAPRAAVAAGDKDAAARPPKRVRGKASNASST